MKERAIEQARALLLEVPDRTLVLGFLNTMKLTPELLGTLQSPVVKSNQKIRIVNLHNMPPFAIRNCITKQASHQKHIRQMKKAVR